MPMSAEEVGQLSRLLDEALALEEAQREPWLAELARTRPEQAQRLRAMLTDQEQLERTTGLPVLPKLAADEAVAAAGERVGPYRLLREIGRGGMGSVWLAERADGSFERQVALKLPVAAWAGGLTARMARERDIGARLEHPHIARLYDAGVDDKGRPYIAMEFIDGQPLDAYCGAQGLGLRARLELFVQVVQAVAYAHGRLVIHRDLKPDNILVDAQGQAHLLDFGIAKLVDETGAMTTQLTREQGRLLTLSYAAPEQIAGQPLGVAADVYALGVVLFELLTGTLPYSPKRHTVGAMEEAILAGDAPLASSRAGDKRLARELHGDIDAILAKAIKRQPEQRYASADALATDLQRYLNGQPIVARPDSAWYRVRKAVRRHRVPILAASVVAVVAIVGALTTLVQSRKAADEGRRAQLATAFVSELFQISTAQAAPAKDANQPSGNAVFVDRAAQLIQTRFSGQPDLQAELYGVVSRIYADLGANHLAIDYAGRQLETLRELNADPGRLGRSLMLLGQAALEDYRDAELERYAQQAVEILPRSDRAMPEALILLARAKLRKGMPDQAEQIVAEARRVTDASGGALPAVVGWLLMLEGNIAEARNQSEQSKRLWLAAAAKALEANGPASRSLIDLQRVLSIVVLEQLHLPDPGRQLGKAAIAGLEGFGGLGSLRASRTKARFQLALFAAGLASFDETIAVLEDGAAFLRGQPTALPPYVLARWDILTAEVLLRGGEIARAKPLLDASVPILRDGKLGVAMEFDAALMQGLAAMYSGDHRAADRLLRELLKAAGRMYGTTSLYMADFWRYVAQNLAMQGRYEDAEAFLASAPAFQVEHSEGTRSFDPTHVMRQALARVRLDAGDVQGARRALPTTVQQGLPTSSPPGGEPNDLERFLALRGEILCAGGEPRYGLADLMKALDSPGTRMGPHHPDLARLRAVAGLCSLSLGQRKQAESLAAEARRAFDAQPDVSPWFKAPLARLEQRLAARPRRTAPAQRH